MLRDIADQFQRWLKGCVEKRNIPVADAPKGRRDDFVDPYFKGADLDAVVIILKAREPARIMTAIGDSKANRWHLQIANRWAVQYNFYINDRQWGRMFVRICPFTCRSPASASISIIGWPTACVRRASISSNVPMPSRDALSPNASSNSPTCSPLGDLLHCGQQLARLTPFFTARERRSYCRHRLFFSQVEFCDNLIFRRRTALDKLGERLLDANRNNWTTQQNHGHLRSQDHQALPGQVANRDRRHGPAQPGICSHYGNGFVKQYACDHLMLRTEAASNNVNDYGVNKSIENLLLAARLAAINNNYLNVQQDILETFVDRGQLRKPRNRPSRRRESAFRGSNSTNPDNSP